MTKRYREFLFLALLVPAMACAAPAGEAGKPRIEEVEFPSHGVTLAGSIAWPGDGVVRAAVVFIHGSGKQERNLALAARFAEAGIAALVYDKRGVGKSGGEYEFNQNVSERNLLPLADDASAALDVLVSRPALRGKPIGFAGISQAGWIAPLAAQRNGAAKFLVLWSGPVCKVSDEDIYSKYTQDADAKTVPSYRQALNARTEKYIWPDFMGADTDPVTSLRELSIPGLWIFSDNDGSIPVDLSTAGLDALKKSGHQYEYVIVPGLGHNNMDGTFDTATNWIRQLSR